VASVPVVLLIGYWLVRRRDAAYVTDECLQPAAMPGPSQQIVDTERGRMQ
jgi:hypothetical protein